MAHLQNTLISGSLTVLGAIDLPEETTIGGKTIATQDAVNNQLDTYAANYTALQQAIHEMQTTSIQIFSGSADPSTLEFTNLNSGDIYLKLV